MLKASYIENVIEAGCDEAGRGPLAGSVFAAAVILDPQLLESPNHCQWLEMLNDSKQLTDKQRQYLRPSGLCLCLHMAEFSLSLCPPFL